jgi:hypothetical protein
MDSLSEEQHTHFLSVDLNLNAAQDLDELLKHLEPTAFLVSRDANRVTVELQNDCASADETIARLVERVLALPWRGRDLWKKCNSRTFSVGI